MSMLTIYGYSDDLIEIEGDIREEWNVYDIGKSYIAISDGTLLSVEYDNDGIWRFHSVVVGKGTEYYIRQGDSDDNSDIVTLRAEKFDWVVLSTNEEDAANPILPALHKAGK